MLHDPSEIILISELVLNKYLFLLLIMVKKIVLMFNLYFLDKWYLVIFFRILWCKIEIYCYFWELFYDESDGLES